jgi:hypothetical protein
MSATIRTVLTKRLNLFHHFNVMNKFSKKLLSGMRDNSCKYLLQEVRRLHIAKYNAPQATELRVLVLKLESPTLRTWTRKFVAKRVLTLCV